MSSSLMQYTVPNVGVIGSGARQNPQKLMAINAGGSLESNNSSRSSTSGSGEEGFISGNSSEKEEILYVDQLTTHFDTLGIVKPSRLGETKNGGYFAHTDAPHDPFSTLGNDLAFEQSRLRPFSDRMKEDTLLTVAQQQQYQQQYPVANQASLIQQQIANLGFSSHNRQPQLPGAWFYENSLDEGLPGSGATSTGLPGECSPIAEINELNEYASFRAALNNPYTLDEHVEVPSSEHVAEIVGRQGCKIKALRAKTNTYIKTPSRNEPPIFKITGRPEDVVEAKKEIECAAEHFTQIRASRRHSQGGNPIPGHVTAYVRVPLRVVGLVVGPKGATIKRIQQDTHTYIITPSREREPIFEVTGLPENVASARREIEQHIYVRTGNMPITDPNASINDYDLVAAHVQAQVTNAHTNTTNRPNYGALATGTHLRRASAALEAALGIQQLDDRSFNDLQLGNIWSNFQHLSSIWSVFEPNTTGDKALESAIQLFTA